MDCDSIQRGVSGRSLSSSTHNSRAWVSSYPEFSQLVNKIGMLLSWRGRYVSQRNAAVERLVAHKKDGSPPLPRPFRHRT